MGSFFRRLFSQLGMTGLVIVLAVLVFGILAGGIVVHRLDTTPAASQSEQQTEASDNKDEGQPNGQSKAHGDNKPPHPTESSDANETD